MANLAASKRGQVESEYRRERNLKALNAFKNAQRKLKDLIEAGEKDKAEEQLHAFYQKTDKLNKVKYITKNKAARIKSKWARRVFELTAGNVAPTNQTA